MIRILLLYLIIVSNQLDALRRQCLNSGILFPDKISQSPIIVYGTSLAKRIYVETDTELLFNITFRVDCIFKGDRTEDRIEITDAGIKNNRTACQWLEPGQSHVVFLDRCAFNRTYFCPMDFQERLVDDITLELLEKTCSLRSLLPLNGIKNNCPNVSMAEFCSNDQTEIQIKPKSANLVDDNQMKMKISFDHINTTLPNDLSFVNHIADNPRNHVSSSIFASISVLILSILTAISIF